MTRSPNSTFPCFPDEGERTESTGPHQARALYVHAPFCTKRCAYCDFATATYRENAADRYLERLDQELTTVLPVARTFDTIYIGGGTPTAFSQRQLKMLLSALHRRVIGQVEEWTCEVNPESLSEGHLGVLWDHDVRRISLGNQSFSHTALQALGREHRPQDTRRALRLLHKFGVTNFNVDLMFAAPGVDRRHLVSDLRTLGELGIPHVSAYCLSYEPGTPLTARRDRGGVRQEPPEEELLQYRMVVDGLSSHGLGRYELSNFARPGFESKHNQIYWRGEEYYGVGLGAGSYIDGVRRTNTRDLEVYLGPWPEGRPPHDSECLEPEAKAREKVVLGLRTREGVVDFELQDSTGFSLRDLYDSSALERLVHLGLAEHDAVGLRLSDRGFELSDSVFVELV